MSDDAGHVGRRAPRRGVARLGAFALGLAVAVLIAELALRVAVPPEFFLDSRTDAYWRETFRRTPGLAPDLEWDAALGWRARRDYRAEGVTHDARGFRVTPQPDAPEGAAHGTIVLLGDSFTYGLGVRDEETYGARLAARLPGWTVLNAAVGGYGLDQQVLMWEGEATAFRPRVVVVGYFVDDFVRSGLSFREVAKPHFVVEGDGLRLQGSPVPAPDEAAARLAESPDVGSRVVAAARWAGGRVARKLAGGESAETFEARRQLSDRLLARLAASVRDLDATLVVLVIPHCAYQGFPESRRIEDSIEQGCASLGIDCVNLTELCQQAEARGVRVFGDNCHWAAAGHDLVADFLAGHLEAVGALK